MGGELGHKEIRLILDWRITWECNPMLVLDFRRASYDGLTRHVEEANWRALGLDEGQDSGLESGSQESQVKITHKNLVRMIIEGQKQHNLYQAHRTENSDPKWMTRILIQKKKLKRGIYRKQGMMKPTVGIDIIKYPDQ